jgi:TM2 domain-containing membrane protein YozV
MISQRILSAKPDPPRSGESRRLKILGLVLMGITVPAFGFLMEQTESKAWLSADNRQVASIAVVYLAASNVFALGLIVLLAGFRDLPLLTNAHARKGARLKLAGANLLIMCFALLALNAYAAPGDSWQELVILLPGIALLVCLARSGIVQLRRGWKYDAVPAEKLLEEDPRPPVVYIRSFKDDDKIILGSRLRRWYSTVFGYLTAITMEQELAIIMNRVGPVVAIGKPGELLPELGAARLYASDDEWRAVITDLMKRASLVVVRAGATANLRWEIDQAATLLSRRQLILVSWAQGKEAKAFDEDVEQRFGKPAKNDIRYENVPLLWLASLMRFERYETGKIIYFGKDSKPRAQPIRFSLSWIGFVMMAARPYRDSLNAAFERVFSQLDLPWTEHKSRTTAALLALFLGAFGVHHFYVGNTRRGLYYLAFSWTFVTVVLGWIDAIRMGLADEQDFQRKFCSCPQPRGDMK